MPEPNAVQEAQKVYLPRIQRSTASAPETPPTVEPTPPPGPSQRVAIDPITRIEGHLRIEVQIENGHVTDAWSSGMMFRGIELILLGRDPRDAWVFTQRICGV
jgi:Ni,Fe-hydrogenase III large subunit